jgi:hypothetical protein
VNAFCATKIGPHMARDTNNFLICLAAPICRSGKQVYRGSEVGLDNDDPITVNRPRTEVCSPACISSFESKPITDDHPPRFLDPGNAQLFQKGHTRNVRPGPPLEDGSIPLLADLVITDSTLIEKILRGDKRELSAGYATEYVVSDDGQTLTQTQIRANHVACVNAGRAGSAIRILDSKGSEDTMTPQQEEKVKELTETINNLCTLMRDEQRQTTTGNRRRPNSAGSMLRDAERITARLATPEGPASLHRFITQSSDDLPSAGSIARDELKRASGELFEVICNARGASMRGEGSFEEILKRYRGSNQVNDAEETFEEACQRRRRVLLGR